MNQALVQGRIRRGSNAALPPHDLENFQSYTAVVTQKVTKRELEQICALRNSYFYPQSENPAIPDINDDRYKSGGVFSLQTPEELRKLLKEDKGSHFLLLKNHEGTVVGYSRFSIYQPQGDLAFELTKFLGKSQALNRVLDIKIVMIDRDMLTPGQRSLINGKRGRPSNFISKKLAQIAYEENCLFMKAEVIESLGKNRITPISLKSKGWERLGDAKSAAYDQLGIKSGVYVKNLNPRVIVQPSLGGKR